MIEKWGPVSDDFTLVNAPVRETLAAYETWVRRLGQASSAREIANIDKAFAALAPLSSAMTRKLLVSAGPQWTAFFQNGLQGSDPTAGGNQLSKELGVIGMRVCATPDDNLYPAVMWEVWAPQRLGGNEWGYRRSIAVSSDGGKWVFEESGEPYAFEEPERYAASRKRERFTKEMLRRYLAALAVDPFAEGALQADAAIPAVLIETALRAAAPRELSYAEAALALKK